MTFGYLKIAHLYDTNVLRQVKYTNNVKMLWLEAGTHPVMALLELKNSIRFAGSIHVIGSSKFFCVYVPSKLHNIIWWKKI